MVDSELCPNASLMTERDTLWSLAAVAHECLAT